VHQETDQLFGILNLGYWDLFEIWFLMLGIFVIFIKLLIFSGNQTITCLNGEPCGTKFPVRLALD